MTQQPIRVGLIGCGGFMQHIHLPHLLASDHFVVVGACDVNLDAAKEAQRMSGAQYATDDYARLLGDDGIDAVIIATRHDSHAELSVQAARAGKHILCEKPMGLNEAECRRVVEAVQSAGVKYTVGYNRGMAPLMVEAQRLLADQTGKRLIYHRIQAPFPATHWTHDPAVGGGRFVGEGCHIFDLLCELIPAPPTSVYASGGTFLDPKRVHIPDSAVVTLTFADGSVGTTLIASDGCGRFPKEATEVYVGGQALCIEDFERLTYRAASEEGDREIALTKQDKGHRRELALFGRAILTDSAPPNGLQQALRAALISYRVLDSLACGQPVAISETDYLV